MELNSKVCTSDDSTEKVNHHVDFTLIYTQSDKIMRMLYN